MRRTLALTLVIVFSGAPAFAQGPIMTSATKIAERSLQAEQPGAGRRDRKMIIGAALIGVGAAMIIFGVSVAKCEPFPVGESCVEETNKGLTYSGLAIAGAGGLLIGLSYLQNAAYVGVGPLPRGVVVKRTVSF